MQKIDLTSGGMNDKIEPQRTRSCLKLTRTHGTGFHKNESHA